jgi:hypothetical protein
MWLGGVAQRIAECMRHARSYSEFKSSESLVAPYVICAMLCALPTPLLNRNDIKRSEPSFGLSRICTCSDLRACFQHR